MVDVITINYLNLALLVGFFALFIVYYIEYNKCKRYIKFTGQEKKYEEFNYKIKV